eukprot:EG_transcript_1030
MTKDWEPLVEVPCLPGTAGDYRAVHLRWRPDGKLLAAVCWRHADGPAMDHRITVWDRAGDFKCEAGADPTRPRPTPAGPDAAAAPLRPGLAAVAEWFPDGSLLATAEWCAGPQVTRLAFCLHNGDIHGECILGPGRHEVLDVRWNAVGGMQNAALAVLVRPSEGTAAAVKVYSRGNYHWYCKLVLPFEAEGGAIAVAWDTEDSHTLHVASGAGLSSHRLAWVTHTAGRLVAVADGPTLRVTDLARGVVPPPLSHYRLPLPGGRGLACLALAPPGTDLLAAAVTDGGDVALYPSSCLAVPHPHELEVPPSGTLQTSHLLRHARLLAPLAPLPALAAAVCAESSVLVLFYDPTPSPSVTHVLTLETSSPPVALAFDPAGRRLYVQEADGAVWAVAGAQLEQHAASGLPSLRLSSAAPALHLPEPCPAMQPVPAAPTPTVVALSRRGTLYWNTTVVAPHVTAFSVALGAFLTYTTSGSTLEVRLLQRSGAALEPAETFEWAREVERGARLVCAVGPGASPASGSNCGGGGGAAAESRLILQMPRGNLETVHPRPLVLSTAKGLLRDGQHAAAFTLLRRHRIDLNVVVDHSPAQFLDGAPIFVQQMTKPNLSLFIASLADADVLASSFPYYAALPPHSDPNEVVPGDLPADPWEGLGKVHAVCRRLRAAMMAADERGFVQGIVGTYAQQTPPAYAEALALLRRLQEAEAAARREGTGEGPAPAWEEGVAHLIFLAQDASAVYNAALAAYDFSMALAVASRSQKDPKEYLPFLRGLQGLPEAEARLRVDLHLGRHERALGHALRCAGDPFEAQFLALAAKHALYPTALALLDPDAAPAGVPLGRVARVRPPLLLQYGEWLEGSQAQPVQAGFAYLEGSEPRRALECFVQGAEPTMAFAVLRKLQLSPPEALAVARRVATALLEKGRVEEAAAVTKGQCGDSDGALAMLIHAHAWPAAVNMATECGRYDLVVTDIKDGLLADAEDRITEVEEQTEEFGALLNRLTSLKERQRLQGLALGADGPPGEADLMSLASLDSRASTAVSSLRTGTKSQVTCRSNASRSSRASKATRDPSRKDRKKLGVKSSGQFEEANVKREVYGLLPKPADLLHGTQSTVQLLLFFEARATAQRLQAATAGLLQRFHAGLEVLREDLGTLRGVPLPEAVVSPEEWGRRFTVLAQELLTTNWKVAVVDPAPLATPSMTPATS